MDNKYQNLNNEDYEIDERLKNYSGPIPAYKPQDKKPIRAPENLTSIIEEDELSKISAGEHTAVLEDDITTKPPDHVASMVDTILKQIEEEHGLGLNINKSQSANPPVSFDFDKNNSPINHSQAYNDFDDNQDLQETSVMDQFEKFTSHNFDKIDNEGTLSGNLEHDDSFYDEFYDEYEEKIGFFERLRIKREEKKAAKQQHYDQLENQYEITNEDNNHYEEDVYEPEELESDYKSPQEARDKIYWLDQMVSKHSRQITFLSITSIITLLITLPIYTSFTPFFDFINIDINPRGYIIVNLILLIIATISNFDNIKHGISGFFTFNSNGSSMLSILTFFSIIYTIILAIKPDLMQNQLVHLYTFVVCISLLINNISHQIEVLRIRKNFAIISSQKEKTSVEIINDDELENDMIKLLGDPDPQVVVPVKANFLKRFFEISFDDYYGDSIDRTLVPICLLLSIVLAVGTFFMFNDIGISLSVFFSSLVISSPLTSLLCTNLPLFRASNSLVSKNAVISGNEAIWDYSQTTSLVVDSHEIFPKNSIILQGIKTFEGGRIDQAIIDAASILHEINSPLSKTFLEIIENRTELLNKVDSIMYEDEMGVSAWIDDRRVLIGNRTLMVNHGVEVPEKNYEIMYTEDGREIVYLATSGELTAMYVVKYMAENHIAKGLQDLNDSFVSLIVRTSDPNITSLKVSEVFNLDMQDIRIIPERKSGPYERATRPQPRVDAKIAYIDNILGYFSSITTSVKLAPTISTSFLIQTIAIIIGFLLITVASFFKILVNLTPFTLLIYNVFWMLVVFIINFLRKI